MEDQDGAELLGGEAFGELFFLSHKDRQDPVSGAQIDLVDDLGLAADPSGLPHVVVSMALFDLLVEVCHGTHYILVGSHMSRKKCKYPFTDQ